MGERFKFDRPRNRASIVGHKPYGSSGQSRTSVPRISIVDADVERNWDPYKRMNDEYANFILGILVDRDASQKELTAALMSEFGIKEGNAMMQVTACLLVFNKEVWVEPFDKRRRSRVWRVIR